MQIDNIDVFVETIKIASACNKFLRKRFMKPDSIGLIPKGGYTCNNRYTKKAVMFLFHAEQKDVCRSCTVATGVNTGSRNYLASVWTVTASKPIECTSSLAVFGTGIHVNQSEISAT